MSIKPITHDYTAEVTNERLPVVVEFYAEWSPKCQMMKDVVERLARRCRGISIFKKVDIDICEKIAEDLGVETVPTFVIYRHGEIMGYTTGVISEKILEERIADMLR